MGEESIQGLRLGLWQGVFVGERGSCGYRTEPFDSPFLQRKLQPSPPQAIARKDIGERGKERKIDKLGGL